MFRFLSQILFSLVLIVLSLALMAGGYWYLNVHEKQESGNLHVSDFDIKEKIVIYSVNDDFLYDLSLENKDKYVALQGARILFVADMSKAHKQVVESEEVWEVPISIETHRDPSKRVINDLVINESEKKLIEALDKFSDQYMKYRVVQEGLLQRAISNGQNLIQKFIEQAYYESGKKHKSVRVLLKYADGNGFDLKYHNVLNARAYEINTKGLNKSWKYYINSVISPTFESASATSIKLGALYLETLGYNQGKIAQKCKRDYIAKIFDPVGGKEGRFFYLIKDDVKKSYNICFSTDDGFLHQVRYEWKGDDQIPEGLGNAIMMAMNVTHNRKNLLKHENKMNHTEKKPSSNDFTLNGVSHQALGDIKKSHRYVSNFLANFSGYFSLICGNFNQVKADQVVCLPYEYKELKEKILKYLSLKKAYIDGGFKNPLYGDFVIVSFERFSEPKVVDKSWVGEDDIEAARFDNLVILNLNGNWPFNDVRSIFWQVYHPDCSEAKGDYKAKCGELSTIIQGYNDILSKLPENVSTKVLKALYTYSNIDK